MPEVALREGPAPAPRRFAASKFTAPPLVSRVVSRSRLFDALDRGADRRLTLIVGAPGAGKTTLLANWLAAQAPRRAAWLSCDIADSLPIRFMAALIGALQFGFDEHSLGADAFELVHAEGAVSIDAVAALADDLDGLEGGGIVAIDDFHLVGGESAELLEQFVDCCPNSLQIVIASRVDPPLRLHRMRAQEQLVELRDRDLAFSLDETRGFFAKFGLGLSQQDIEAVQLRTEGWSTGLQMTALSLRTSPEGTAVHRAEVNARTVAGYFLEEVLYRQPPDVVDFMLATSVLDELSLPACAALTGDEHARILESLLNAHLFVTLVDAQAGKYRYHQLIKEVLQAELHARDPSREASLHEAAARHLLSTGHAGMAARHLLAAGESATAFSLLTEGVVRDVLLHPTVGSALDLDEFRPELFAGVPQVLVPLAAELLWRGSFQRGSRAVALARETRIDASRQPDLAVRYELVNTLYCSFVGEFEEALAHREHAREFEASATEVDDWILTLDTLAMYCCTYVGDYVRAHELADMLVATGATRPLTEILCPGVLSQAAVLEGSLAEAGSYAASARAASQQLGFAEHFFSFHALRTLSQLALERRDLNAAGELIEVALRMVNGSRPAFNFLAQIDRARVWAARGQADEALASLPAAREALKSERSRLVAEADELEARLRLALGDLGGARRAAQALPDDRRIVVGAILDLAQGHHESAGRALLGTSSTPPTTRSDLELQLLRANVALVRSPHDARQEVRHALGAAHRRGYVQTVVDTAPQLLSDVRNNPDLYPSSEDLSALVAAFLDAQRLAGARPRDLTPVQPLTDAEIRVLAKLAEHLSYAEAASELFVSLNTVKTHVSHAYTKLGVTSRRAAIARVAALGLV